MATERVATRERSTRETQIRLTLNLDGEGRAEPKTGIGFFDHMLTAFARHGFFDLSVEVQGDLEVDGHHTVEDTGLVLGAAFREALGDKAGIEPLWLLLRPDGRVARPRGRRFERPSVFGV